MYVFVCVFDDSVWDKRTVNYQQSAYWSHKYLLRYVIGWVFQNVYVWSLKLIFQTMVNKV